MKLKIDIKPIAVISRQGTINELKRGTLSYFGCEGHSNNYGDFLHRLGTNDDYGFAYSIEGSKRGKHRKQKTVVFRIYEIPFGLLDATNTKIQQHSRYFRLVQR